MIKNSTLIFILFALGILVVVGFQIYVSVFSSDDDFDKQVENHLISIVQIKGERINDYFLERKHDVLVLADSVEVKGLLKGKVSSDAILVGQNIKNVLEVISKQIEIFVNKYPEMSFSELQNDEEFQGVVEREVGKTGSTSLVDFNSFDKNEFDYFKSTNVATSEGVNLGIAAKVNFEEFKTLDNPSVDLVNSMKRFKEISDYKNLILTNSEGYVVYEVESEEELGTNLRFNAYRETDLGNAYFEASDLGGVVVYGPYLEIGASELVLLFVTEVYDNERLIGAIILQDSMDDVNDISTESTGLGETGDSYIIDENKFLITPSRIKDADLLIQEVETEDTERCFAEAVEEVLYFSDFKGDDVIGTYAKISEVNWCLVAEIEEREVFDLPKQGKIKQDLAFILVLNLILLILGFIFIKKLNKKGKRK